MNFENRLRRELERTSKALPVVGVDLRVVIARGRKARRRTIMVTVAAAGAALALVIAGTALLTRSTPLQPQPQPPAGDPTATAPTETPDGEAEPSVDLEPVLREWLRAIQDGDEERVWSLMTPEARETVGRARFDDMMASALPEGLGAFADAPDFHQLVIPSKGDDLRAVGVVSGEVTREGTEELAAMAIPMRVGAETLVDDPFIGRGRYYDRVAVFASESLGPSPYLEGDELIVEFAEPRGATAVYISVDDETPLSTEFDPGAGVAVATLDRDLAEGAHIATIVVVHRSGRIYPEAIFFEAAALGDIEES